MTEAQIEQDFVDYAHAMGCRPLKLRIDGEDGFPDRTVLTPDGGVLFVEFKRPGGRLRPQQKQWLARLQSLGHPAIVATSVQQAARALCDVLNPI